MAEAAVHEGIGDDLPRREESAVQRPQRTRQQQARPQQLQPEDEDIGDQQVAGDRRQTLRHAEWIESEGCATREVVERWLR